MATKKSKTDTCLAAVGDEVVPQGVELPVLHPGEQVRVIAALAQLHDDVQDHRAPRVAPAPCPVHHVDVSQENVAVNVLLLGGQPWLTDVGSHFWHRGGRVGAERRCKTKHERERDDRA